MSPTPAWTPCETRCELCADNNSLRLSTLQTQYHVPEIQKNSPLIPFREAVAVARGHTAASRPKQPAPETRGRALGALPRPAAACAVAACVVGWGGSRNKQAHTFHRSL
jgi:hypothetical protein